jgi:hypothetical protein
MWELIRANKQKSIMLMVLMMVVLVALGLIVGYAIMGPRGGLFGILIAVIITFVLMLISLSSGDQIFLAASKAKPVTKKVHPQLFNIVEEMKIAAALPAMPKIYIINDPAPNAFATGRKPEKASIAVTAGLLARLNRDELQGVIAHEISPYPASRYPFCYARRYNAWFYCSAFSGISKRYVLQLNGLKKTIFIRQQRWRTSSHNYAGSCYSGGNTCPYHGPALILLSVQKT